MVLRNKKSGISLLLDINAEQLAFEYSFYEANLGL